MYKPALPLLTKTRFNHAIMIENEPHGEGYQRPFFVK